MKYIKYLLAVSFLFGAMWFFTSILLRAIDKSIENQDTMLCESALKSRNRKYLKKCECYYQTGEIKCLQK